MGYSKGIREKVYNITGGRCYYCGCSLKKDSFEIDHYIPKADGGKGEGNRVPSCKDCNVIKSNKSIEVFRKDMEDYLEKNIHGRMIKKYLGVNNEKVKFHFEDNDYNMI